MHENKLGYQSEQINERREKLDWYVYVYSYAFVENTCLYVFI